MSGGYIHFFSESSAGQVSLLAYLPGYNFGCPDKSAKLNKKMVKKIVLNLNISVAIAFYSCYSY